MIFIPEIAVFNMVNSILTILRADLIRNSSSFKESILYRILGENKIGNYHFANELAKTLNLSELEDGYVNVHISLDLSLNKTPTIYIVNPSDNPKFSGLGSNEGYKPPFLSSLEQKAYPVYNTSYDTVFYILILSNNSLQALALQTIIRAMVVALTRHLEFSLFQNLTVSNHEVQLFEEIVPAKSYLRNVSLAFSYELEVIGLDPYTTTITTTTDSDGNTISRLAHDIVVAYQMINNPN